MPEPLPLLERLLRNRYAVRSLLNSPAALVLPPHVRELAETALGLNIECSDFIAAHLAKEGPQHG